MTGATIIGGGSFSPVSTDANEPGPIRTDEKFDIENLKPEERDVVEADEFIIFGKANIEQFDDPEPGDEPQKLLMDALEEKLDQLHALDNLSRRHQDVKVGEFRREHTLDEDSTIHLDDDDSLKLEAGDTVKTEVIREGEPRPDGTPASEDALWLVANVFGRNDDGGSVMSEETRLGAYYGLLDGFSVTIFRREYEPSEDGEVVSDLDFLAVTIGEDELIKNKGSHFGVAEFKAMFGDNDEGVAESPTTLEAPGEFTSKIMGSIHRNLFQKSADGLAVEVITQAYSNNVSLEEATAQVVDDESLAGAVEQKAEEKVEDIDDDLDEVEDGDEREDLASDVAEELGIDKEEAFAIFAELESANEEDPEDVEEPDDEPDDEPDEPVQMSREDVKDLVQDSLPDDVVTEGDLDDFVTQEALDDTEENIAQKLEDGFDQLGGEISENLSQKMQTGGTPDPSGGNGSAESDIGGEVDSFVEEFEWGDK